MEERQFGSPNCCGSGYQGETLHHFEQWLRNPLSQTSVVSSVLLGPELSPDQNRTLRTQGQDRVLLDLVFQQVEPSNRLIVNGNDRSALLCLTAEPGTTAGVQTAAAGSYANDCRHLNTEGTEARRAKELAQGPQQ